MPDLSPFFERDFITASSSGSRRSSSAALNFASSCHSAPGSGFGTFHSLVAYTTGPVRRPRLIHSTSWHWLSSPTERPTEVFQRFFANPRDPFKFVIRLRANFADRLKSRGHQSAPKDRSKADCFDQRFVGQVRCCIKHVWRYFPFAFSPGRTPSVDGRPSVSRRSATEPRPRSGKLSNISSDASRTLPTVLKPAAASAFRMHVGN